MASPISRPYPYNLTSQYNLTYPLIPFNGSYPGPQDNGIPGILAGLLIPHIICTVFILARVWSRLLLLRKWFLDDTLIVVAWACSTAVCVVYSLSAESPSAIAVPSEAALQWQQDRAGGGVHPYIMQTYLGLVFYQLCLCVTKLSVLAFYLRMFSSRPRERYLAWASVVFVLLYGAPMLFMSIFQCHPADGEFFGRPALCFCFPPLLIASASLHTVTDAWLIVMIVPCISRLELPPRQKVALAVVLSLSIFVVAASLVRLQLALRRHMVPVAGGRVSNTMAFFVMTILECDIALICACAPTLRPLAARLFPRLMAGSPVGGPRSRRGHNGARRRIETTEYTDSVDLTAVSYHGYPWTQPGTPVTRTRNGSIASHMSRMPPGAKLPVPPVPALAASHRTPTSMSLKSVISGMAPRSRGRTASAGEEERPIIGRDSPRRASAGFEGYHGQYMAYGDEDGKKESKRPSLTDHRWGDSQESFVLGLNDPLSPRRLSPISGFSGDTVVNLGALDAASLKDETKDTETGRQAEPQDQGDREESGDTENLEERRGEGRTDQERRE